VSKNDPSFRPKYRWSLLINVDHRWSLSKVHANSSLIGNQLILTGNSFDRLSFHLIYYQTSDCFMEPMFLAVLAPRGLLSFTLLSVDCDKATIDLGRCRRKLDIDVTWWFGVPDVAPGEVGRRVIDDIRRNISGVEPISEGGDVDVEPEAVSSADWLRRQASCSLSIERRFIARESASKRRNNVRCFSAKSLQYDEIQMKCIWSFVPIERTPS